MLRHLQTKRYRVQNRKILSDDKKELASNRKICEGPKRNAYTELVQLDLKNEKSQVLGNHNTFFSGSFSRNGPRFWSIRTYKAKAKELVLKFNYQDRIQNSHALGPTASGNWRASQSYQKSETFRSTSALSLFVPNGKKVYLKANRKEFQFFSDLVKAPLISVLNPIELANLNLI